MHTSNQKRVVLALLTLVLMLSFTFSTQAVSPVHAGGPPSLFTDASDLAPADAPFSPHWSRSRFITVNQTALFDSTGKYLDSQQLPEVTLNLFDNVTYTGKVNHAKKDRWANYWWGSLKGVPNGYFYMVVADGYFTAHIASPQGVYEVKYAGNGLYRAVQLDQSTFKDHPEGVTALHDDYQFTDEQAQPLSVEDLSPNADTAAQIDVMVAYTKAARIAAGGYGPIKALIALAVLETNVGYANSGVTTRIRLVHIEEYTYTEVDPFTDLARLQNTSDAHFSTIHTLRNTYGADMVGLIVEGSTYGGICGLATSIYATAANAFQVTNMICATGYYSFGHEFGHLQGARHDPYVDPSTSPFAYGHGYVHIDSSAATSWRTVMGYGALCGDIFFADCTRLQYWSNPNKTYVGDPMGNNDSKNFAVLNNTALTVANFRSAVIGKDFNSNFNGSSTGWSAVKGTWGIYSASHYYSTGIQNKFSSAVYNGIYGDVTYEARMKRTGNCDTCTNYISIRGVTAPLNSLYEWNKEYKFNYSNDGMFSVYEVNGASNVAIVPWTASAAIVQNNWNTLKVIAVGSSLKFYINGTLVSSITDPTFRTGRLGFGFYKNTEAGRLYVTYAKASTSPTADMLFDEQVAPGVVVPGGNAMFSPAK